MKRLILNVVVSVILVSLFLIGTCFARNNSGSRPYKDYWGNSYKSPDNFNKDTDKDGVPNYLDYNDRNRNIQTPYQKDYNNNNNSNTNDDYYYNKRNRKNRW